MSTISQVLANFAHGLQFKDIPEEVAAKIKLHLLDILGICFVSSKMEFTDVVIRAASELGNGQDSTVIGLGKKLPMVSAALVNGTLAHGIDFDDSHIGAVVHVSAPIVATGLVVGEAKRATGKGLLEALAVGMETSIRLGLITEGGFNVRGMHQTAMCTPFGACLTVGKLLQLPVEALVNALGVCGTMASGITQIENSWLKRINPGWAAHSGIIAAHLGNHGYVGPLEVFEGVHGHYRSHLGEDKKYDWRIITDDLGKKWETLDMAIKPYPCCHYTHAFIDCAKFLRENYGIKPQEIERIECKASPQIVPVVLEPKMEKIRPKNPYGAQFSTQYLVAAMFCKGVVNLDTVYFEPLDDPQILALAEKVAWVLDPETDFPKNFPGDVKVVLKDGRGFGKRQQYNRGGPRNPIPKEDIVKKFLDNACRVIGKSQAEEIVALVERLETIDDLGQLIQRCVY